MSPSRSGSFVWPAEDAGPAREQRAAGRAPTSAAGVVARELQGAHMVVVREPGAVFVYGSTFGSGSTAWVERIDPGTLEPLARVDGLAGGPWWPGGIACHADGSVHVVHGRWAHRLSSELEVLAARELPRDRAYNSFVTLPDGRLITKDLLMDGSTRSHAIVLEPDTLEPVGGEVELPEGSIARLSADGAQLYVVGDHTVYRYRWDGAALVRDEGWSLRYRTRGDQGYGWDPVIAGGQVWFLDNGEHAYAGTMSGRGIAEGPAHLVRVSVDDASDHELVAICGAPSGAVTNPPLYDADRRIAVGYDSANEWIAAFDFDGSLHERWRWPLATAGHLVLYPDDGALVAYDHHETEHVVVLDITSGEERARFDTGSPMQSVVFPAAADGVVYYCSFSTIARIG